MTPDRSPFRRWKSRPAVRSFTRPTPEPVEAPRTSATPEAELYTLEVAYAAVMSRRRKLVKRVVLGVVLVPLLLIAAFILRATVFAPTFDVPSIRETSTYQDRALLDRAWALPVARTYDHRVVSQSNGSVCGPSSLANILRSLGDPAATQDSVLEGSGKCGSGICFMGLTLDEVSELVRRKGRKVTVIRDLDLTAFRGVMKRTNDPTRRFLVNFHRGLLFGKGTGHHSPIAGYLEAEDLVFVLDVNEKFGPWLVPTERLFEAMDSVDSSSGKKRGLLEIE